MTGEIESLKVTFPEILRDGFFPMRQAARQIHQFYDRHLSQVNLSPAQFVIIALIKNNTNVSMADVGEALRLERTTVVRAVQQLVKNAYVATSREKELRGRRLILQLTPEGEKAYRRALPFWQEAQLAFCENVENKIPAAFFYQLTKDLLRL